MFAGNIGSISVQNMMGKNVFLYGFSNIGYFLKKVRYYLKKV